MPSRRVVKRLCRRLCRCGHISGLLRRTLRCSACVRVIMIEFLSVMLQEAELRLWGCFCNRRQFTLSRVHLALWINTIFQCLSHIGRQCSATTHILPQPLTRSNRARRRYRCLALWRGRWHRATLLRYSLRGRRHTRCAGIGHIATGGQSRVLL